jgi:hypothetical protein
MSAIARTPWSRSSGAAASDGEDRFDQGIDVRGPRAVVDDGAPDDDRAVDLRRRRGEGSALLEVGDELGVLVVRPLGEDVPEAHDVERDRGDALELRLAIDALGEAARERARVVDGGGEPVGAECLERVPDLQRAEAARQVGPEVAGPGGTPREPAALLAQVLGVRCEGAQLRRLVAHHDAARVVGDLAPLVEVERDRVGCFDAGEPRAQGAGQHAESAERAVDVKPELLVTTDPREGGEVVDRAGGDRARRPDDHERLEPRLAIASDRRGERGDVDPVLRIGRHETKRVRPEPGHVHRAGNAAVGRRGRIGDEPAPAGAGTPDLRPGRGNARDHHADEIRDRRPGHEQPPGRRRKAEQLGEPPHHLTLHFDGCVIAPTEVRVQPAGEHLAEHAEGVPASVNPTHEPRVHVPRRERQDATHELGVDGLEWLSAAGKGLAQRPSQVVRHRAPDRPSADARREVDDVVEHPVRFRAERGPVGGVERCVEVGGIFRHPVSLRSRTFAGRAAEASRASRVATRPSR